MIVRYRCPDCGSSLKGRPILAFRRPPAQIECSDCRRPLSVSFTYRLFWCYQLAVTTLFIPLSLWLLWSTRAELGTLSGWLTALGGALFIAFILGMVVALPLTFALRPAAPHPGS